MDRFHIVQFFTCTVVRLFCCKAQQKQALKSCTWCWLSG